MDPVEFDGHNIVYAKDQPQYRPLPAHLSRDGRATFCWKLTEEEKKQIAETGVIWHQVLTCGKELQPQILSTQRIPLATTKLVIANKGLDEMCSWCAMKIQASVNKAIVLGDLCNRDRGLFANDVNAQGVIGITQEGAVALEIIEEK